MKSRLAFILLFAVGFNCFVNAQLNDYKYIIVPKKFDAFKSENEYQTSTLVKHYLTEYGLTAVYDDSLPLDLAGNRCLGLMANLVDESSMFTTKLILTLKNCQNQEVFRTMEGKSKIKEFDAAYKDALEHAFVSFSTINYEYQAKDFGPVSEHPIEPDFGNQQEAAQTVEKVIEQKSTLEEQTYKSVEPRPSTIKKADGPQSQATTFSGLLYAQPMENGYQLVDSTPKIVLKLEETSMENVFLTEYAGNNAVVFKKEDKWVLEYSENGEKKIKELNIKF